MISPSDNNNYSLILFESSKWHTKARQKIRKNVDANLIESKRMFAPEDQLKILFMTLTLHQIILSLDLLVDNFY